MTQYTKWFNRHLPLFVVQYWYRGEALGVSKYIPGYSATPLFIHERGRAVSVYYNNDAAQKSTELTINHLTKNPEIFETMTKTHQDSLDKASKTADEISNLPLLLDLGVSMWPGLTAIMIIGEKQELGSIAKEALAVREKTGDAVYALGGKIWDLLAKKFPELGHLTDFLTIEEIVSAKIPNNEELKRREENYIYHNNQLIATPVTQFESAFGIELAADDISEIKEIKGSVASPGRASGKVKIIFEIGDMAKFKTGDILVSPMTVPDFLPAMHKAAAFITDEGGITCHAAIVAREMKKPCIIGTKIATQVLKDGDLVEVDANKGIVRKLS